MYYVRVCNAAIFWPLTKGGAECGSWTKGWKGGVQPNAEKKIVTSLILMVEVVADVPKGTLDGSAIFQNVEQVLPGNY